MLNRIRSSGATINDIERLTLEEIFIASVQSARDQPIADAPSHPAAENVEGAAA